MSIQSVETIRIAERPNLCFVRIGTDDGLVGLGESYFGAAAVEAYIHETVAPNLLGRSAADRGRSLLALQSYLGRTGSGVESRGIAAVDLALWDLAGQFSGQSLTAMLGGAVRDSISVYNTCAGSEYVRGAQGQQVSNWGTASAEPGPYEDLDAFLTDAGALARSLLEMGIRGMKIWPFDPEAEASGGHRISSAGLERALQPFRLIRNAVGDQIDIMVELHGLWDLPSAERIAHALEPFDVAWLEDPIRAESPAAWAELRSRIGVPIAGGETLGSAREFLGLLAGGGVDVVIADLAWARGISEMPLVAGLAALHERPIAFHDCTGPVTLAASTHLALATPNVFVQEIVRASLLGWYRELVTGLPQLQHGTLTAPLVPGHGVKLRDDLDDRPGTTIRRSTL